MRYEHVCIESLAHELPPHVVTSDDIEQQLAPVYERLGLPFGRLELMTGIRERRIWPVGTRPSGPSITTANQMLDKIGFDRRHIGCLIHASVCRDFLEPATASVVHDGLGLSSACWTFDISNACLGLLNGLTQIAALIESGAIKAGIVVGTENSRSLLEQTVKYLNGNSELTRQTIKTALASLTIGSASCAMLLVHESLSESGAAILTSVARCHSLHNDLCRSDHDSAGTAMQPLMDTDAEQLLHAGIAAGMDTFGPFLTESQWSTEDLDATICHQVGGRHRAAMLESLGLSMERDTATFPWMGNTGSVALPTALAAAAAWGRVQSMHRVGLLGIGSGINCVMVGSEWSHVSITGNLPESDPTVVAPSLAASVERV